MMPLYRLDDDDKVSVGCPPPPSSGSGEKSFQFHFHDFANLATTKKGYIASPEFACFGHQWLLAVYPGGSRSAAEGNVSAHLFHLSKETITAKFDINIVDKFGNLSTDEDLIMTKSEFSGDGTSCGFPDLISRSDILDESKNILDSNGTLAVVVTVEEEPTVFVPQNPLLKMMQEMFNDENTADVCFEVGSADKEELSISFYAHRFILEKSAPMLAAICESDDDNESGGVVTASVNDVEPHIFRHLLSYVYGRTIPEEELKAHAKDIIDAADKYSIINLKLAAEAAYFRSTDINLENAIDNLLYADSRNCALLKEAVMNFLAGNHCEAAANISFSDFPGHVVKDLLVAFGRNSSKDGNGTEDEDDLTTLCVSSLRKKLDKMGLDVDGSREAMIESIKSHS